MNFTKCRTAFGEDRYTVKTQVFSNEGKQGLSQPLSKKSEPAKLISEYISCLSISGEKGTQSFRALTLNDDRDKMPPPFSGTLFVRASILQEQKFCKEKSMTNDILACVTTGSFRLFREWLGGFWVKQAERSQYAYLLYINV